MQRSVGLELVIFACLLAPACGYRLVKADNPFGAASIAVVPFVETNTVGIAPELAQNLTRLLASGGVALAADASVAQAILSGRIHVGAGANATIAGVTAYQLNATVTAELIDRDERVLWRREVVAREDFLPASSISEPQPLATETNRRMALHRLAERIAAVLHENLLIASTMAEGAAS